MLALLTQPIWQETKPNLFTLYFQNKTFISFALVPFLVLIGILKVSPFTTSENLLLVTLFPEHQVAVSSLAFAMRSDGNA